MPMIVCMKIKEQHIPITSFAACVYLFTKVEFARLTTNEWYFFVGSSTKVADRFPVAPTLSCKGVMRKACRLSDAWREKMQSIVNTEFVLMNCQTFDINCIHNGKKHQVK